MTKGNTLIGLRVDKILLNTIDELTEKQGGNRQEVIKRAIRWYYYELQQNVWKSE